MSSSSSSRSSFLAAHGVGLTLPGGRALLRGLSVSFGPERVGLVGANGVGKSLFLEILAGVREPTSGRVSRSGRVGWVPQSSRSRSGRRDPARERVPPSATVAHLLGLSERLDRLDRVLAGAGSAADVDAVGADWDLRERVGAVLDRLGLGHLELERPAPSLSGGEATRVRLARPVLADPDILLLDEPTNDLDAPSRRGLEAFLDAWDGGVVVVTHDRALLEGVDRIVELSPGGLEEYGGGWSLYREVRERERAAAREELEQAEAARRTVEASVREVRERRARRAARGRRSRSSGSQPRVVLEARRERSQGTERRGGETEARLLGQAGDRVAAARRRVEEQGELRVELAPSGLPARKEVLSVRDLAWRPPGADAPLLDGVALRIRGPERVAVTGPNGCGKSSFLHLVCGRLLPERGEVVLGVGAERTAWLDQSGALLGRGGSVLEAFRRHHPELDPGEARSVLARFLFPGDAALAPVETLSGGERMRAALACVLGGRRAPALLLLDEPTNHLDLDARETVEEVVASFDGALLVVSHDPAFLEAVGVERTLALG